MVRLVEEAMSDTSELLGNLEKRRSNLMVQRQRVQDQIGALVGSIADRESGIKSVGKRIVELEEQEEQLDEEILELDMEIEAIKSKAVSAKDLTNSLTTFGDLYQEALPEERWELVRLRVNQLIWTPEEIQLALFDTPYQRFDESQQLVAPTVQLSNRLMDDLRRLYDLQPLIKTIF